MFSQNVTGKLLKGLYGATVTALGSLATVLTDDVSFTHVTPGQWVNIALFSIVAFGGAFGLAGWAGPTSGTTTDKP